MDIILEVNQIFNNIPVKLCQKTCPGTCQSRHKMVANICEVMEWDPDSGAKEAYNEHIHRCEQVKGPVRHLQRPLVLGKMPLSILQSRHPIQRNICCTKSNYLMGPHMETQSHHIQCRQHCNSTFPGIGDKPQQTCNEHDLDDNYASSAAGVLLFTFLDIIQ